MKLAKKLVAIPATAMTALAVTANAAFAETTASPVITAIQAQATSLSSDAGTVIASALSVGCIFFGAKVLWSKFKSMAR